jgi:[ribosomal protein S5]-alanine N-acetyltransferase
MTEAMAKTIEFGFTRMNLNSIEANIDPENHGSIRLVEKVGFERDGYIREHSYCFFREKFVDTILFTARASQWTSNQPSA